MLKDTQCGELTIKDIGREVKLAGWVHRWRDHGGIIFIDLRDRSGIVQLVFDPSHSFEMHKIANALRSEYVIYVEGKVRKRPEGTENLKLTTGEIEILVSAVKTLNTSKPTPINIGDDEEAAESVRFKYRYLDMRRPSVLKNFIIRHKATKAAREYLNNMGFLEIETPLLIKPTPEGARDYLVPSRVNPGKFYALPQSPQLFKQILMVAGIEKYYQIAKCLRDEDLRADRQPEFTQIDIEMSFVDVNDIIEIIEGLFVAMFKNAIDIDLKTPFPRLTYEEAMQKYGTDKPDLRFGFEMKDITSILSTCSLNVFKDVINTGGIAKSLTVPNAHFFSRKELDDLIKFTQGNKAKGLAWLEITDKEVKSPIAKFLTQEEVKKIIEVNNAKAGEIIFIIVDKKEIANNAMSLLRLKLAEKLNLINEKEFCFVWVVEFPAFEYDEIEKRIVSKHHPFTMIYEEDIEKLETEPLKVRSKAYDIILNGVEVGGGSIRIHKRDLQEKVFEILGISKQEAEEKFGFLLEAFEYGTPPHGGIAPGLDRLVRFMAGVPYIRDVIAFPKTQSAICPLTNAPFPVSDKQLRELSIKVI